MAETWSPEVVAFDVIETVFSLKKLRSRLTDAGLPAELLELWFAHILRDAFALNVTGDYRPFRDVASAALTALVEHEERHVSPEEVATVVGGFSTLEAHADAGIAFRRLHESGIRILTLTNGSSEVTDKLLQAAGLAQFVEMTVSVDEVRRWKPHRDVYIHAAQKAGVVPGRLALVAAHAWDIHGAGCAGLKTVYVARSLGYPEIMHRPDYIVASLADAAVALCDGQIQPNASEQADDRRS